MEPEAAPRTAERRAIVLALLSALAFGASAPIAKILVGSLDPVLLAGLLYLGSGLGITLYRLARMIATGGAERFLRFDLPRREIPWLAAAVLFGGILAPISLLVGLRHAEAATATLILNAESILTAFIAWAFFREHIGRRVLIGIALMFGGCVWLSYEPGAKFGISAGALGVLGASAGWALDNNLTRHVSGNDPFLIAWVKGMVAGITNVAIALALGASLVSGGVVAGALALGAVSYGASLVLFVMALAGIGATRTCAYFGTAPFSGALLSLVLFGTTQGGTLAGAGLLMAIGAYLIAVEHHEHEHEHEELEHEHEHVHDEHHRHEHAGGASAERHTHRHRHEPIVHAHPHVPDLHHRHGH